MLGFPCRAKTVWLKIIFIIYYYYYYLLYFFIIISCKPVRDYSYHFDEYLCGFSYTLVIKTLFFCQLLVDLHGILGSLLLAKLNN